MHAPTLVRDHLAAIRIALERIKRRFVGFESSQGFLVDDYGIEMLDSIAMMFIAMGEEVNNLDRVIELDFAIVYPNVDWKGVKGIRDVLSHHCFPVDAEIIFEICQD